MFRLVSLSLLVLVLAAGLSAPAGGQNPSTRPITPPRAVFTEAEKADLRRVSDYLNTLRTVQGRFMQIAPTGKMEQGTFYLRKPGRVRFEYDKPNPNVIVADGTTVAVENSALKTTDRYPLANSPLRLLLSDTIDLSTDPRISAVKREGGVLSVTARETSGPAVGSITLSFADAGGAGLELRQWEVVDAQGARTTVVLTEMRRVAEIPARLFVIQDLSPFNNRR